LPVSWQKRGGIILAEQVLKDTKETEYGTRVILEVSGKLGVQVGLDKEEAKGLKPGDKLRFKTLCRGVVPKEDVVLCFGRILKEK
jgi:hypothetical protein